MTTYFDAIRAESLTINRSITSLVWGRKGPGVQFLAANSVAKLPVAGAAAAVAAATGYLIGTNSAAWEYKVNGGSVLRFGMATAARSMAAVGAGVDVIFREFKVLEGDPYGFALSATALTITPPASGAAVVVPMAGFAGQILYPWAANTPVGEEYSLTIRRTRGVTIGVTAAGGVEISTANTVDAAPLAIITGGAGLTVDGAAVGGGAVVTTFGPSVVALAGSVILPTPSVNITITFSRVGNTVTMNWTPVSIVGVGAPSVLVAPNGTVPLAMRPANFKWQTNLVKNAGVYVTGMVSILNSGEIFFGTISPGNLNFAGGGLIEIYEGAVTWIAGL